MAAESPGHAERVVVGRLGRAHGVRGEISLEPLTDEPERRFVPGAVLRLAGSERELTVGATRPHQGRLLVRFAEVADRTAAESLSGSRLELAVDPADRPEDPEEFYDHQLLGLRVLDPHGTTLGEVVGLEHNAAQDLLVVSTGAAEVLVPFVAALVPHVDLRSGTLVVDDLPGLFTAEATEAGE